MPRVSSGGRIKYRSGKEKFPSFLFTAGQEFIIQNPDRRDSPPQSQLISETINSPIKPLYSLSLSSYTTVFIYIRQFPLSTSIHPLITLYSCCLLSIHGAGLREGGNLITVPLATLLCCASRLPQPAFPMIVPLSHRPTKTRAIIIDRHFHAPPLLFPIYIKHCGVPLRPLTCYITLLSSM